MNEKKYFKKCHKDSGTLLGSNLILSKNMDHYKYFCQKSELTWIFNPFLICRGLIIFGKSIIFFKKDSSFAKPWKFTPDFGRLIYGNAHDELQQMMILLEFRSEDHQDFVNH